MASFRCSPACNWSRCCAHAPAGPSTTCTAGHRIETDPVAYFAFNQAFAWADPFLWAPLQIAGSIGMLLGQRWGFLLALMASVPFWYTSVFFYIWDRDLGFRENTFNYWFVIWGMWPLFGVTEGVYCFVRLVE